MNKESELLLSAANELKSYIDDANAILKHTVSITMMSPPDYHDYQTCQELADLAKKLERQDGWISVDDELPDTGRTVDVYSNRRLTGFRYMKALNYFRILSTQIDHPVNKFTHWMYEPKPPTT